MSCDSGGSITRVNYQTDPVHRVELDEVEDVAVHHKLGDHEALSCGVVNIDCDKRKDVRVRYVLPKHNLLAEMLRQTR